jgi:peptidoglycan lytic transglycosylase D
VSYIVRVLFAGKKEFQKFKPERRAHILSISARFLALLLPAIIFFPGYALADGAPQTPDSAARLTVTAPASSSPAGTIKVCDKNIIADAGQITKVADQSGDAKSLPANTEPSAPRKDQQSAHKGDDKSAAANPVAEAKTASAPSSAQAKPAITAPDAAHAASEQEGTAAGSIPDPASDDSAATDPSAPSNFLKDDTATVVTSPDTPATAPAPAPSAAPVTAAAGQPAKPAIAGLGLKETEGGGLLAPVARDVQYFSITVRKHFQQWLARSGKYMSLMKSILRENYMPEDLVFLALIESGFNPKAYSFARAAGPWQFIRGTAIRYGLRVDKWVDERRDPVKSTVAAAAYLKDLYGMFGSWPLAMASYNAGEGNVERAINRTGGVQDFWKLRQTRYMPSETKDYVPKFIAARMIAQNPDNFGFKDLEYDQPFVFDEVQLDHCTDLRTVALCCGVPLEEIKDLNPELIKGCTPPDRTYTLRIPKGKKEAFLAAYNALPKNERFATPKILAANTRYVVRRSDSLKHIAGKLGVPVAKLAAANRLKVRSRVRRGRRLLVPREKLVIAAEVPSSLPRTADESKPYTKTADAASGTTETQPETSSAAAAEKPASKKMELGSLLPPAVAVADAGESTPDVTASAGSSNAGTDDETAEPHSSRHHHARSHSSSVASSYRVRRGDTLASIARRHHTTTAKLARLNGLGRHGKIEAGQTLALSGERVKSHHTSSRRRVASLKKKYRKGRKRYQVKNGDTLWSISRKFGVSREKLSNANSMGSGESIKKGQTLIIPSAA